MLDALRELVPHLEDAAAEQEERRGGEPHPADDVEPGEFAAAADAATATLAAYERATEIDPSAEGGRESAGVVPLEDWVFMPRDALLSILQSTLEAWVEENHLEAEAEPPDDRRGGGEEVMVTDQWIDGIEPEITADNRRWFGPFEVAKPKLFSDPLWLSAGVAMGIRQFRKRHAFNDEPAEQYLEDGSRIVMVGDWGSGLPRALHVRDHMRERIEEGIADKRPVHVIHLGDVYYSGFGWEYTKRFLRPWPVDEADDVHSWTLAGNHDMYSGGYGYYDVCLKDPRFVGHQGASWFRLANEKWQIVGLDSAWEDRGLKDPQPQRLEDWVLASDAKVLLLSHHQPFSVYSRAAENLRDRVRALREQQRITAWFWGHEHGLLLYEPHDGVKFGRCLGNGGIPEYMTRTTADPYIAPAAWEFRERRPKLGQPWNTFGFAVLDLKGERIEAAYFDEDGNPIHPPPEILS